MKRSVSNLQTAIFSAALLFGVVSSLYGYHGQMAFADGNMQGAMSGNMGGADDLTSPITEWIGMTAIGMTAGLIISLRITFNNTTNSTFLLRKTILASTTVLLISVV